MTLLNFIDYGENWDEPNNWRGESAIYPKCYQIELLGFSLGQPQWMQY